MSHNPVHKVYFRTEIMVNACSQDKERLLITLKTDIDCENTERALDERTFEEKEVRGNVESYVHRQIFNFRIRVWNRIAAYSLQRIGCIKSEYAGDIRIKHTPCPRACITSSETLRAYITRYVLSYDISPTRQEGMIKLQRGFVWKEEDNRARKLNDRDSTIFFCVC